MEGENLVAVQPVFANFASRSWRRGTLTYPPEYPFRDDGFLLWNAINEFTLEYIKVAYKSDKEMRKDPWLQVRMGDN